MLADDHPLFLAGLRALLENECEVVGVATDGRALVEAASRLTPEVIVVDIGLPGLNGIEATRQIKEEQPEIKILFLTMHTNPAYLKRALAAGATGYVLKTSAREELVKALRDVTRNRIYVSPGFREEIVEQFERHPPHLYRLRIRPYGSLAGDSTTCGGRAYLPRTSQLY
jgi:DNA-binding NarL/FixJ family response regulator